MRNILDLSIDELKQFMKEKGEKAFRANQVFDWIYKDIFDFDKMKNLSRTAIDMLKSEFYIDVPKVVEVRKSAKDDTVKFLFSYRDGNVIESVTLKYDFGYTICVSTQVGCRMGCKFCASTKEGMIRNLTSGEILGEIIAAQLEIKNRISNVVLMGSGEPLDNYDNVIKFIELANSKDGLNIGERHFTLSTCGIVPKIIELADKKLQITLAISLHAPFDDLRKSMMPIANKYTISEIIDACKYYIQKTNKRITFEYSLVKGVNDSIECAEKLAQILHEMLCNVNLIPVNEIKENTYKKSSRENIIRFQNTLADLGLNATIRRSMGEDIDAACGQLRRSYLKDKGVF